MAANQPDALSLPEGTGDSKIFGIQKYTQIPNAILDVWLPDLNGAELKVLLYLCRRTFGFHRDTVAIGMRLLAAGIPSKDGGTGLHVHTVSRAVKSLEARGLIRCTPGVRGRIRYSVKLDVDRAENPYTTVRQIRTVAVRKLRTRINKNHSSEKRKKQRCSRIPLELK